MIILSFFYRLSDRLLLIFLKINVNLARVLCSQIRYMLKKNLQHHGTNSVLEDEDGFKDSK